MPFTRMTFEKLWTRSEDFPTLEDNEAQVREDFQYHPDAIKKFLNEVFMSELEGASAAKHIGSGDGTLEDTLAALAEDIDTLDETIRSLASGGTPEAFKASKVEFMASDWVAVSGGYSLLIPKTSHHRESDAYGCNLRSVVNGEQVSNTWDVLCTEVDYDSETENITLVCERAYDGVAVFFGL